LTACGLGLDNEGEADNDSDMQITKEELQELYSNNRVADAANILGVSIRTFLTYVKKAGIPPKKRIGSRPRIEIIESK
jgi:hypothetical protein